MESIFPFVSLLRGDHDLSDQFTHGRILCEFILLELREDVLQPFVDAGVVDHFVRKINVHHQSAFVHINGRFEAGKQRQIETIDVDLLLELIVRAANHSHAS